MDRELKRQDLKSYVEDSDAFVSDWEFPESEAPQPCSWKEVDAMVFPENPWLVKNLIPKEGTTIFASISGEGKSLLMMHLARCLSEGTPWFGNPEFETEQAKVLYVNLEMSLSEMQRRGRKIGFELQNENLTILNEDNFNLNEGYDQDDIKYKWLLRYIYEHEIRVVIIDTFRAVCGGLKEEKAEEVRKFFQKFMILKNSGVSVIFLEHVRKPTQLEGKVPKKEQLLGSQDKTANAEVLLMIRRDEVTKHINIYQRKNRLGNEVQPFSVSMNDTTLSDGTEVFEFVYEGVIDDDATAKEEAKKLILDILSLGEAKNVQQLAELMKKQVGKKNLRAALKELDTLGKIDYYKDGRKHVYFIPKEKKEEVEDSPKTLAQTQTEEFFDDL